jgi:tripartite-type tricarboxylate transporter receptor subunit TctC
MRFFKNLPILGLALLGAVALSGMARAQDAYPSREITLVCGFPAGSGADVFVRYFGQKLHEVSGATVIVENKVGAAGNLAAEYVVRAKPDGYNIYFHTGTGLASNYHIMNNPPFDPAKALKVAATVNKQPFMIAVAGNSPYKTLQDLTDAMKKKGDTATYATSNSVGKVLGELYKQRTGVQAIEVSYKSAIDSLNDLQSGSLDYAVFDPVVALSQAKDGKIRNLAVSSETRIGALPDVPTIDEAGVKGLYLIGWFAAFLPADTPRPVLDRINGWFAEIMKKNDARDFITKFGGNVFVSTPDEGQALLAKDVKDWKGYVELAQIPKM